MSPAPMKGGLGDRVSVLYEGVALGCWNDTNTYPVGGSFVIWQTEGWFTIMVSQSVVKETFI